MDTQKPIACITGASSGIGAEYARQLASKGYDLILVARRKQRLEEMRLQINEKYAVQVDVFPADLSLESEIIRVEEKLKTLPNLEVLVNNAGFGIPGEFYKTEIDTTLTMLAVHVQAVVRLTRAIIPGMIARGSGYIINISSLSAFTAALGNPMYSATKCFLNGFSDALATELQKTGVEVQVVCPGMTRTEFHNIHGYEHYRNGKAIPDFVWMSAEKVVSGSLRALQNGRVIYIPGLGNQLAAFLGSIGAVRFWARLYMKLTGRLPVEHLGDA